MIEDVISLYTKNIKDEEIANMFADEFKHALKSRAIDPIITLDDIYSELPYIENTEFPKRSIHVGQRKLFDNELQFCTEQIRNRRAIVFYAGAAPCNKGAFLASLFPNCCFVLIDPNKFDIYLENFGIKPKVWSEYTALRADEIISNIVNNFINNGTDTTVHNDDRINIINDFMTLDLALAIAKYCCEAKDELPSSDMENALNAYCCISEVDSKVMKRPYYYFISDIRTNINNNLPETIDILWNHAQQYNWLTIMKPISAMLKFRHPFYEDTNEQFYANITGNIKEDFDLAKYNGIDFIENYKTKKLDYFDGTIYLQPFGPKSSTESRLVTNCKKIISYGLSSTYDNKFFFHNNIARGYQLFKNPNADRKLGFDYCCDCALENYIWERYIKICGHFVSEITKHPIPSVQSFVKKLSKITHRDLIRETHGKLFGRIPIHILMQPPKQE
jgi:hypothetical protein